ncbi:uncharacterized protein A4U43_C05F20060 [Asparagus officinalis]|uniref:glucan endo-1,3-beta-D-glucosidase n=1 Tax=Asparagus officinalis TaxID=4686 RepID=A0A5P1EWV7_ASPOF|nr:glucan endo-1,3-beta-glucosidase 12-like isoform X2 [Asparagus officinalis]ONK69169.1 uncharacterized protein A4U43_C05F20060 [Asparagus officinalis]
MAMERDQASEKSSSLSLFFLILSVLFLGSSSRLLTFPDPKIGINYGRLGSNLPSPEVAMKLISSLAIKNVKTFDMDPLVIRAFANTNISLSLCIPNGDIYSLASDPTKADCIVKEGILPFYRETYISSIAVGNEVTMLPEFAPVLLNAMENLYRSLKKFRLHQKIKVSTPHSLAVLAIRFPPSDALFQESIAEPVLRPVLRFLSRTNSPFMVNLYPYLTFKEIPYIPLDFALFLGNPQNFNFTDPKTGLVYTNLFDLLVDALNSAVFSLGFHKVPLVVTETGWPSEGDADDNAASLQNAAIFNQRLVNHLTQYPIKGTPLRPGVPVLTFLFSLFDEDLKPGATTEKHWGIFYANGTKKS